MFGTIFLLALVALAPAAHQSGARGDVPQPPPPPRVYVDLPEASLLDQLTAAERAPIDAARAPRDRHEALAAASDLMLADARARAKRGESATRAVELYEALVVAADRRLRSPEAAARVRDKLYKRFERRLVKQLGLLQTLREDLPPEDLVLGESVTETVERVRTAALHSAIDADMDGLD